MRTFVKTKSGVTIVEVMIGLLILSTAIVFIYSTFTTYFAAERVTVRTTQALYLAEEGQEIMRYLRDSNWTTFSALSYGTPRYLAVATSSLATSNTPELIDETFTRTITIDRVYRNSNDDVVASTTSGATVDSGSRHVTVAVTWGDDKGVTLYALLSNIHDI